jgi:hypothetical protein
MLRDDGKAAEFLKSSGGAENFTAFIEKELMPYIDQHYPTVPHRMLIGHSFGGLFAINAVVHHPTLFNTVIAIDPSMWWDNKKLLDEAMTALKSEKLNNRTLYVGVANTMPTGTDYNKVEKDTSRETAHIRSILKLTKLGSSLPGNGLRFGWKYYPNDSHGSVPLITEYDGIRFIYDFYKAPAIDRQKLTPDLLSTQYKSISDKIGYAVLPPEQTVNGLGYEYLFSKDYDRAFGFFKLNIDNYPKSFNVFDSMGDYYVARADKTKAIEYFNKALALQDFPDTRRKLEELKK